MINTEYVDPDLLLISFTEKFVTCHLGRKPQIWRVNDVLRTIHKDPKWWSADDFNMPYYKVQLRAMACFVVTNWLQMKSK